ncbi:MAG: ester cyclase, partial [Nocardioides sp.]
FGAAWERGDMTDIDDFFADTIVYHVPTFPDMDKQGLKDFIASFRLGFHDFRDYLDENPVDGARSLHRWHCDGVFAGATPLLPAEPTGRGTTATGTLLFHWQDGRIREAWHAGDWLGWLTRAGVLPPLG